MKWGKKMDSNTNIVHRIFLKPEETLIAVALNIKSGRIQED